MRADGWAGRAGSALSTYASIPPHPEIPLRLVLDAVKAGDHRTLADEDGFDGVPLVQIRGSLDPVAHPVGGVETKLHRRADRGNRVRRAGGQRGVEAGVDLEGIVEAVAIAVLERGIALIDFNSSMGSVPVNEHAGAEPLRVDGVSQSR